MPLNSSGPISLGGTIVGQSINLEIEAPPFAEISLGSTSIARLYVVERPTGPISFSDFYNKVYKKIYGFTSTTTFNVPATRTYTFYAVGGGGGASNTFNGDFYGSGGGSGLYATTSVALTAGDVLTINIGAGGGGLSSGGATTIVRSGSTLLSAAGGSPGGNGFGGAGGSGGGPAPANSNFSAGIGGYNGSNGQNAAGTGGAGQLGVTYGNGTNPSIPPGGSGGYIGAPWTWGGILGFGGGRQAGSNENGLCAGGGAGGGTWAQSPRSGSSGLVVIYG